MAQTTSNSVNRHIQYTKANKHRGGGERYRDKRAGEGERGRERGWEEGRKKGKEEEREGKERK